MNAVAGCAAKSASLDMRPMARVRIHVTNGSRAARTRHFGGL